MYMDGLIGVSSEALYSRRADGGNAEKPMKLKVAHQGSSIASGALRFSAAWTGQKNQSCSAILCKLKLVEDIPQMWIL